jgi:hypothetical protein
MTPFFDAAGSTRSTRESAQKIAIEYQKAVTPAVISTLQHPIVVPSDYTLIENGFFTTFTLLEKLPIPPNPLMYIPAALGIVAFWTSGIVLNPLPTPPGYVLPIGGSVVLFPGLPLPLNVALWAALSGQTAPIKSGRIVATLLTTAFIGHLATVSGIYTGTIPNPAAATPPTIPGPPIPWVGMI